MVWQDILSLAAMICHIPSSNLNGILTISGQVRMPLLEWEGRVLPARRLAEFVPLSDTQSFTSRKQTLHKSELKIKS